MSADRARPGEGALIGWQTLLADLSLILFMVTAAAMSATGPARRTPAAPVERAAVRSCDPVLGEPLAVWRAGGSRTLRQWLAGQQADARQQLTITARYRAGAEPAAAAAAQALVAEAGAMGSSARVVLTPAGDAFGADVQASLAYDRASPPPDAVVAQDLRGSLRNTPAGEHP